MSNFVRSLSWGLTALVGATAFAGMAAAQAPQPTPVPAPAPAPAPAPGEEDLLVLGSRIPGVAADGAAPAIQITREEIVESGATEAIDLLRDLTITSGGRGTFSTSTAGALSGSTPPGSSAVSLRGLGTSATLTLINGRRASVSAFANGQESFIDVGSIPTAAIERIEVLPSGASALYGADAVAGVVNFVLREDFRGFEVTGSYGDSTADTDEGRLNLNAIAGTSLGGHDLMLVVDYFRRNALFDRDRSFTKDSVRPSQQGFFPSFNNVLFRLGVEQVEAGCPASAFGVGPFGEFCAVDENDFVSTQDRQENIGGLATHRYDFGGGVEWFNEILFQRSDSRGTSSPANFSLPVASVNPFWPAALRNDLIAAGSRDFAVEDVALLAVGKYPQPRAIEVESDSLRFTTGLEWALENGWDVTAAALYGRNERTQRGVSGLVRTDRLFNAAVGNLCTDLTTVNRYTVDFRFSEAFLNRTGTTCEAAGKTTLWYNPFGGQTQQAAGINPALRVTAERKGVSELTAFDVGATGELFTLFGRPVQAALGAEYRDEKLEDTPSGLAVATNANPDPILGFSSTSARAERTSWALYAELAVPLHERFELQLAGRYDDYEVFGGDFNPKVAFRFEPIDDLIFRGSWSTSFRAPSLAQSGAGVRLTSFRVDCRAVPAACGGSATARGRSLLAEELGNPNLQAEEAESWGLGGVAKLAGAEITLDYWNIRHEGLVGIARNDFLRRALADPTLRGPRGSRATGVAGIEVDASGFVTDAHIPLTNLGYQETSGVDFTLTRDFDLGASGVLTASLDATYLLEFERQETATTPVEALEGSWRYPQTLVSARLRWRDDAFRATVSANYTGAYDDDQADERTILAAGRTLTDKLEVDSWLVFDLNLGYDLTAKSDISLNVQNVLDEDPPKVLSSSANVDHINHDSLGRFVTIRFSQAF